MASRFLVDAAAWPSNEVGSSKESGDGEERQRHRRCLVAVLGCSALGQ